MKLVKHAKPAAATLKPASRAWSPLWPLQQLHAGIERLLEEPLPGGFEPGGGLLEAWGPAVDVCEDKHNLFVKVELPGMKKEEIEVSMDHNRLNITGERKAEAEYEGAASYCSERYFGRFARSIELPAPVDAKRIEAHYKDGVLTVTCPKTEEAKRKHVEIQIG